MIDTPNTTNIKAVFFDIDGTLVSFKTKQIPQSTERALKALKKQGVKIIISTGRSVNAIQHVRHLDFDGFITFNGGCCLSHDDQLLARQPINSSCINSLLDHSLATGAKFSLMYEDKVLLSDVNDEIAAMYAHINLAVPPLLDRSKADVDNVLQANLFMGSEDERQVMETVMTGCVATRWSPLFADVNHIDVSKQKGVDIFCQQFGIDVSETMSFGDGGNDITMLKHTGIGVAMGNAGDNVKAVADYVTDEVDEDGILNALRHFGVLRDEVSV